MPKKMKQPQVSKQKHPMQPVGFDEHGVVRFKRNKIVCAMIDAGQKLDLNMLAVMMANGDFSKEDYTQLMQLLGYSVSGAGDLSQFDRKVLAQAEEEADKIWKEAN